MKEPKFSFEFMGDDGNVLMMKGVRTMYQHLWQPGSYQGTQDSYLSCSYLIPKSEKKAIKVILAKMADLKGVVDYKKLKDIKLSKIKEGDLSGNWVLKTRNSIKYPATYFDHTGTDCGNNVAEILANGYERTVANGNYVNVKVELNPDQNENKVWTNTVAIQFLAKGEPIGGGGMSDEVKSQGFDAVDSVPDEFKNPKGSDDDAEFDDEDFDEDFDDE